MRRAGVENLEIDWEKFVGHGNQHDVEAKYAKEAGKHDELVKSSISSLLGFDSN